MLQQQVLQQQVLQQQVLQQQVLQKQVLQQQMESVGPCWLSFVFRFLEKEAKTDICTVCKNFTFDELTADEEKSQNAKNEILERLKDAAAFYKVVITEAKIILRDPNAEED
ncbi:hypothetical protein, conserved [Eimeria tenella]|uniref:Uncharacterized protein n=1 Tax=Eimeria tenella TaxID=5802 RepID=U6KR58_EIMTE|nr:hypothetical protein, conserved [Eimeria tenella]CDJ40426.1 hypothetical protein, conserved [Eimeria tenella]|eukprot:XP_013231176.1 hypothetical protein, conserved [Eimeria tenella]